MADDPDVAAGEQIYQQLTGGALPGGTTAPSTDPDVAAGEQIHAQLSAAQTPAVAPSVGQIGGKNSSVGANLAGGGQHGSASIMDYIFPDSVVRGVSNALNYIPYVGPALNRGFASIDTQNPAVGYYDRPSAVQDQAYAAGPGQTIAGEAGNVAGQIGAGMVATAPIGVLGGALADAAGGLGGAGAITGTAGRAIPQMVNGSLRWLPQIGDISQASPVMSQTAANVLRGGILTGTGAAQGATAATMAGGNPIQGAIGGGALGAVAPAVGAIGKSLDNGGVLGSALHSKVADALVALAGFGGGGLATHALGSLGYIGSAMAGLGAGGMAMVGKYITQKYGPTVAAGVEKYLAQPAATSGLSAGFAGIAGGNIGSNPLQTPIN